MAFPKGFLWGVSESGFQFEMGVDDVDANTDWFVWVHDAGNIQRKIVSGDLPEHGPGYWKLYEHDHQLISGLGLNAYRLGVEWSRVFPSSTKGVKVDVERNKYGRISRISAEEDVLSKLDEIANKNAVNHYRAIIEDLASKQVKPIVCLNHFTLPLWIHNPLVVRESRGRRGPKGWLDEESVVEFWKFAVYMAYKLGDLVDMWATMNEPNIVAEAGYLFPGWGFPPAVNNFRLFRKCLSNLVVAHARAYDAIKEFDRAAEVGVILNIVPLQPLDPVKDGKAAELSNHIHNMFFINAVSEGWIDENLNMRIDEVERDQSIGQRLDWLGVNYYSRNVVRGKKSLAARVFAGLSVVPEAVEGYGNSCKPNDFSQEGNPTSDFGWEIYPSGIVSALKTASRCGKPLYVTENGVADAEDRLRPKFIEDHVTRLEEAIEEEKLDVRGYFHWALVDNYEWASGYRMKFGFCEVDLRTKERKPRKSYQTFREIISRFS